MTPMESSEWSGPPPHTRFASLAAYGMSIALLAVAGFYFVRDWQRILDLRPVMLTVRATVPEQGGWRGDPLRVASGRTVRLTVASVAGTHSFALAHTDVRSSRPLAPGEQETVQFVAPAPGRYVLYCTTWCSADHWRMRTVLEVFDPADPDAALTYPQEPQRFPLAIAELPLDTVHQAHAHAANLGLSERPDSIVGEVLWQRIAPSQTPLALLADLGWPVVTPLEVYELLRDGAVPGLEAAAHLSDDERWSLVAYWWQQTATPASLGRGASLFAQNCADCHGETGQGDGMAAAFSPQQEPDFTDPSHAATRSPAVYYAKIARGGMGSGMPNWGTILDEEDLWALTDYLTSLMFDNTPE